MLHDKMQRASERIYTFKSLRTQTIGLRVYIFATDSSGQGGTRTLTPFRADVSKTPLSTVPAPGHNLRRVQDSNLQGPRAGTLVVCCLTN